MASETRWILQFFLVSTLLVGCVAAINAVGDPLFYFGTQWLSFPRSIGDDREQKINYIFSHKNERYDAIMIGSSRIAHLDPNAFHSEKILNLGCSSLNIAEYEDLIRIALNTLHDPPNKIYLGLDFTQIATSSSLSMRKTIEQRNSFSYIASPLISLDTLKLSIKRIIGRVSVSQPLFSKAGVWLTPSLTENEIEKLCQIQVNCFQENRYSSFDKNFHYREIYENFKKEFPNVFFKAFTTPESEPVMNLVPKNNLQNHYAEWLKTIVAVFGEVYHFHIPGTVSKQYLEYFIDGHHLDPKKSHFIIEILEQEKPNPDYCIFLDNNSVQNYTQWSSNAL